MGIPLPPKTPMGAYAEYFKELYPTIRNDHIQENGKINSHEVARVAGARWSALSEQDKKVRPSLKFSSSADTELSQRYNELSKRAGEKYKSDYKRYYESLTDAQIADLGLESPSLKGLGTRAKKAATRKARGEPGRPVGSFFLFLHDFRKSPELKEMMERDGIEGAKVAIYTAKKAGEKWAVMSTEEKEVSVSSHEGKSADVRFSNGLIRAKSKRRRMPNGRRRMRNG